jgi:hypothetical protein
LLNACRRAGEPETAAAAPKIPGLIGNFAMGQRVEIGPVTYTAMETRWETKLGDGANPKVPQNRFLVIKLSVTNGADSTATIPLMKLQGTSGQTYEEVTEGADAEPTWFGMLRHVQPVETTQGVVIFDVPLGGYKLDIPDGDVGQEKHALIDIPLQLQSTQEP